MKKITKVFLILLIIIFLGFSIIALQKPSLNRDWSSDQEILADISFF